MSGGREKALPALTPAAAPSSLAPALEELGLELASVPEEDPVRGLIALAGFDM